MALSSLKMSNVAPKKVLLVGGTRFSGLYLWKELQDRGHDVTLFNRGKTALRKTPRETEEEFEVRKAKTTFIAGDTSAFTLTVKGLIFCAHTTENDYTLRAA